MGTLVLPDGILCAVLLNDKVVGSGITLNPQEAVGTFRAATIKFSTHVRRLCAGPYKLPTGTTFKYPKTVAALCLTGLRV